MEGRTMLMVLAPAPAKRESQFARSSVAHRGPAVELAVRAFLWMCDKEETCFLLENGFLDANESPWEVIRAED